MLWSGFATVYNMSTYFIEFIQSHIQREHKRSVYTLNDPQPQAEAPDPTAMTCVSPAEDLDPMTMPYAALFDGLTVGKPEEQWWKPESLCL